MNLTQYSPEQLKEMSMVEVAFLILSEKRQAIPFKELMDEMTRLLELTQSDVEERIAQFYTDLNIDGRFICIGENSWGLRSWYPYDQIDEETQPVMKSKKKKVKKVSDDLDLDDLDDLEEEEIDFDDLDDYEEDDDDFEEDEDFDGDDDEVIEDEYDLDEDEEELDDDLDVEDEE